jgi:hypothetical protein
VPVCRSDLGYCDPWNTGLSRPSRRGRELWFHLRSGAAIAAGHPWLTFIYPACQQIGEIDLRTLDRHPDATIESLILSLSCRRCQPNPPFVKLLGLFKLPNYR